MVLVIGVKRRDREAEDEGFAAEGADTVDDALLNSDGLIGAQAEGVVAHLEQAGERAWVVGEIAAGPRGVEIRA